MTTTLTRRHFLSGTLTLATALRPGVARAQAMQTKIPPGVEPKPKGPLVFLDYDQDEIDASYNQQLWAPNQDELTKRNEQKSAAVIARLGRPRRLPYGPSSIEQLDLYATTTPNAPIHVFVHGGAWRTGSAAVAAYMAEMFVDAGSHFIALDFNNAPEVNGDLMVMALQVQRAVAWIYANAASLGGDRNSIYVSGHSSGAHLTAVLLTTDWQKQFGVPADVLKGAQCISGMYDLYPPSLSKRSAYVNFTRDAIATLSPIRHLDRLRAKVIVAHGTLETPDFQRQSREFAAALKAAGNSVELIVLEGCNHFEVAETLGNPYGLLGRAALKQMELRPEGTAGSSRKVVQ